jgi:hypothetical protein
MWKPGKPYGDSGAWAQVAFIGPTASLQVVRDRLSLVAGPSFGLSAHSPEVLGRAAASLGF